MLKEARKEIEKDEDKIEELTSYFYVICKRIAMLMGLVLIIIIVLGILYYCVCKISGTC